MFFSIPGTKISSSCRELVQLYSISSVLKATSFIWGYDAVMLLGEDEVEM